MCRASFTSFSGCFTDAGGLNRKQFGRLLDTVPTGFVVCELAPSVSGELPVDLVVEAGTLSPLTYLFQEFR